MPELQQLQTSRATRWKETLVRIEQSVDLHQVFWLYGLLAAGFLLRIWHASGTFLNSDEVMHFAAANHPTWLESYRVSLAICSHFSAFLFAPALGIYALWRMWGQRPPLRVIASWIAGQVAALGLCAFLYVTQIRQLSRYFGGQDATQGWMGNAYLSHSYF